MSYQNAAIISYIPFLLFASLKEIRDVFIRVLQLAVFVVVKLLFVVGEHFLVNCSYCNNYYSVSKNRAPITFCNNFNKSAPILLHCTESTFKSVLTSTCFFGEMFETENQLRFFPWQAEQRPVLSN